MERDQSAIVESLDQILTEAEVIEFLGISKNILGFLRTEKQLPFCKVSRTKRFYLTGDLVDYLKSRRTVLNKVENGL